MYKKILQIAIVSLLVSLTTACQSKNCVGMQNPWTDCNDNYACAEKITGFNMPLNLSNYTVRAMKGMIEVTYPLDEIRNVTVRKTLEEVNNGDISGDYNKYPRNEVLTLKNGVQINVRRDNNTIYVMYFAAESGYYSARCEKGMSEKEVEGIYNVIAEVEASKLPPEAFEK